MYQYFIWYILTGANKLDTISDNTGAAPCCNNVNAHVKTCVEVDIHPEVLLNQEDITFDGLDGEIATLQFSNTIPPRGIVYKVISFPVNFELNQLE